MYNCVYCFKLKLRHLLAGICEYFTMSRGLILYKWVFSASIQRPRRIGNWTIAREETGYDLEKTGGNQAFLYPTKLAVLFIERANEQQFQFQISLIVWVAKSTRKTDVSMLPWRHCLKVTKKARSVLGEKSIVQPPVSSGFSRPDTTKGKKPLRATVCFSIEHARPHDA